MSPLFNLNLKPTIGALVQWIRASHWAPRLPMYGGLKLSSALMTSNITLTPFPYEGCSKYDTETFAPVDPPHEDTISPSDSDSLADTDSDCTLKIVDSIESPYHESDSSKPTNSEALEDPPLVDSHVFTFRTYPQVPSHIDGLDFWCAGEDQRPFRRGSLPYGGRSLRHSSRTRPWSVPCGICLIHERHPSTFGTGAAAGYTISLPPRPPRPPRPPHFGIAIFDGRITGGVKVHPSNKWGNNPPAGYI